ncbi:septum formation family protein [Serinibacter salmoneus]|uniref:Putative regulator of septum formation n=1 Tax=Serinibacter salmoneus TaxID=556530 RepID=A0A2A9D0W9_9MICO|nr:septum formation family protein [Serinibacter salmoneus]PFG20031.1 putative regulator of septum formation [Serinibacter salmoneus]
MTRLPSTTVRILAVPAVCAVLAPCTTPEVRDESGEIVEGGDTSAFQLRIGDCYNDPTASSQDEAGELGSVPTVPCSEPHQYEVFAEQTRSETDFPGEAALATMAEDYCGAEWDAFIGVPYEESALYASYLYPSQESWTELDDRLITCVVYEPDTTHTESLRGAGY